VDEYRRDREKRAALEERVGGYLRADRAGVSKDILERNIVRCSSAELLRESQRSRAEERRSRFETTRPLVEQKYNLIIILFIYLFMYIFIKYQCLFVYSFVASSIE
jgi:hypothetical protein